MSYEDDFDNNPFAQPQSVLVEETSVVSSLPDASSADNFAPYNAANDATVASENQFKDANFEHKQHQELPKLPDEERNETQKQEPDLTFLPERRSKKNYFISINVVGIERVARKDPIVKLNAQTNLPNFRSTIFKDVRRTYQELEKFCEYLNGGNPECFVPSLPPSHTSYGAGSEEDEELLTVQLQSWFNKITDNPILIRNEEFVFFIENDFGYSPIHKGKVPATGLRRKTLKQFQPPYDEVTELVNFRPYIKGIYVNTQEILKSFEKMTKIRKSYGLHTTELGHKITEFSSLESAHSGMMNLWRKFGKCLIVYGDIEAVKSVYESALFGDEIRILSNDSYVIKEQLTNRHLLMRELLNAEQLTRTKHAQALRAKTKRYEDPIKIDQIITELEESKKLEDHLKMKIKRVSSNMLIEKEIVLKSQDLKLRDILKSYTQKVIETERKVLSNFEKIRLDVRMVDSNGGLSRLGRENYPKLSSGVRNSQRVDGDDWSGDRKHRRQSSVVSNSNSSIGSDKKAIVEDVEFDAKTAASLLGTSSF